MVGLVCLVYLVSLVQPNIPDSLNRPERQASFLRWPLLPPPCYDDNPMSIRAESGRTNLAAIGVLIGLVITGVWIWKRLSLDAQEYVIDKAIPLAFAGLVVAAGVGG